MSGRKVTLRLLVGFVAMMVWLVQLPAGAYPPVERMPESMEAEKLFVYGTLLDPDVQRRVIGRIVESRPDVLAGYEKGLLTLKNEYYIAIPNPKKSISGGVLVLTHKELRRTDRYEGPNYERAKVRLQSGVEAWVYRQPSDL